MKKILPLLLLLLLFLQGCIQDELDFDAINQQNWQSKWAVPLIDTRLSLDDIVTDSGTMIVEGSGGLLSFVYETNDLISLKAEEAVDIPDQDFTVEEEFLLIPLPAGAEGTVPLVLIQTFTTDTVGQRIDSLRLKSGFFSLTASTNLNRNVASVKVTVPSLVHADTRDTLSFMFDMANPGGGIIAKDTTISLAHFVLVFDKYVFNSNQVKIKADITYIEDNNPDLSPYFLQLENGFSELEYSIAYGYFGNYSHSMSDTINLEVLEMNEEGQYQFGPGSVNMYITTHNSIGLPVRIDVSDFMAWDQSMTDSIAITLADPSFEIGYPDYSQIGSSVKTEFSTVESNLHDALNASFSKFRVDLDMEMNDENDSTILNFLIDTSRVKVDLGVELQLFGALDGFLITDTTGFDFGSLEEVTSAEFRVITENLFPINAKIQVIFYDSLMQEVHRLIPEDQSLALAASVSDPPEYRATTPSVTETTIFADEEILNKLSLAETVVVKALLSTAGGQLVKVYSDSYLRLRVGVLAGISF